MAFNDIINRTEAAAELTHQVSGELIEAVQRDSIALRLGRMIQTDTKDSRIPVLAGAPTAFWVAGDTGLKQTSKADFSPAGMTAEEIAVIVPVADSVMEDQDVGLWESLRPALAMAFARKLDAAVLFGTSAPASWGASLAEVATANTATVTASGTDAVADLLGAAELIGTSGYNVSAAAVRPGWEFNAAAQRSDAFHASPVDGGGMILSVAGMQVATRPPYWEAATAEAILADWSNVLVGVRRDLTIEVFTTGVIQDDTGTITHNLLQQDMSAIRCTMRVGYALAVPDSQSDAASPTNVSMVTPAA